MEISLDNLSPEIQQFIQGQLAEGKYQSAEEVVESVLLPIIQKQTLETPTPKNTRGMFAHLNVPISFDEIEETSKEACRNFPRNFPGS